MNNKVIYEVDIENFIKDFKCFGTGQEIIDCFKQGYCYWFAYILKSRFPKGEIYYNICNHFVYKYNNRLYDITGDCTNKYNNEFLYSWNNYKYIYKTSVDLNYLEHCCIQKNYCYPNGNYELEGKFSKVYL